MLSCCFLQPKVKFCLKSCNLYVPAQRKGKWGREQVNNTCVKCIALGLARVELTQQPIQYCALHLQQNSAGIAPTFWLLLSSAGTAPKLSVTPRGSGMGTRPGQLTQATTGIPRAVWQHTQKWELGKEEDGDHWCPCFLRHSWASLADGN